MADEFSRLWLQSKHNRIAIDRARQEIGHTGRALPCRVTAVSGSIVTVQFEVDASPWTLPPITIPKAESPWIRMPTQIGDKGFTIPADAYLGGISGLGTGTATFKQPHNLTALVFVPVSNSGSAPDDQNAAQVCGPNGAIIRTTEGTASSVVVNQNGVMLTYGPTSIALTDSGMVMMFNDKTVTLDANGFTINGIKFETHGHDDVQSGSDISGTPVNT